MQCTRGRLLTRQRERGGWTTFRRSWAGPSLQPSQQIDVEITRRQVADRKALSKARTPFANYFRAEFRRSPTYHSSVVRPDGVVSSYNAARLMTDPRRSWYTPWSGRAQGAVYAYKRGRRDILQPVVPAFGQDGADAVLVQLMRERFAWDKEDGLVAPRLVPAALRAASIHCCSAQGGCHRPQPTASSSLQVVKQPDKTNDDDNEEDCVVIDGVSVAMRSPRMRGTHAQQTSRTVAAAGVDTIPTLVLDALRGPLLVPTDAASLTLRWQAETRRAASVQAVVQLRQRIAAQTAVALPPRSLALLLKAAAAEMEEPALDVALVVAVAEQYNEYGPVMCLELLRCLRRVALVRGLSAIPTHSPEKGERASRGVASTVDIPLYSEAGHMQGVLHRFVSDAGPQLMLKVWSRLPEHSAHFLRHRAALDWLDLLAVTVELTGPQALPQHLPNAASHDAYAAKYLFFRYTLQIDEAVMQMLVQQLRGHGTAGVTFEAARVLWLCAALLVRLVAESVGDVLRYVGTALQEAVQTALSNAMQCVNTEERDQHTTTTAVVVRHDAMPYALLRLKSPAIRAFERLGQRRPRRVRVRLIPYEAFPRVTRCLPPPCLDITQRVQRSLDGAALSHPAQEDAEQDTQAAAERCLRMPCVFLLAHTTAMMKQVKRACGALKWATLVLRHVCELVHGLPPLQPQASLCNAHPTNTAPTQTSHTTSVVVQRRQELCYAYVRSRVQDELDALFTFVPWHDVEAELQPMLEYHTAPPAAADRYRNYDAKEEEEEENNDNKSPVTLSQEEQQAAEMLRHMQECVDDFQLAVSDVLAAHEAAFPELYNEEEDTPSS